MNIQLSQAVSDVTGVTGQAIIRAILSGVRDPKLLASLREPGCKPVLDGQSSEKRRRDRQSLDGDPSTALRAGSGGKSTCLS